MSLSVAVLTVNLQELVLNTPSEGAAVDNWAQAFDAYMQGAQGLSIGIVRPPSAVVSMKSAMAGLATEYMGATKIAAGVSAYWAQVVSLFASSFPSTIAATLPTGLSALAANLQAVFTDNMETNRTASDALAVVATTIHEACQGGTVTAAGTPPVVGVIT